MAGTQASSLHRGWTAEGVLQQTRLIRSLPVFRRSCIRPPETAAVDGLDVRATSYGEPFAYRPEDRPAMAVDGEPSTAWLVADRFDPIGQSIQVSGDLNTLSLLQSQQPGASRMIAAVQVDFDNGTSQTVDLGGLAERYGHRARPARSTFVKITIMAVATRRTDHPAHPRGVLRLVLVTT